MQRGEVRFAATALDDVLVGARVADFLFGGGDAAINLIGRIGAAARETAAEFGVVMLVYLRHAIDKHAPADRPMTDAELRAAIEKALAKAPESKPVS